MPGAGSVVHVLSRGAAMGCCVIALVTLVACKPIGIDNSQTAAVSNDDTYATLGYLWSGARSAITSKKEQPLTSTFSLQLASTLGCPIGGQGSFHGTLIGTDTSGTGSANLALTGSLAQCSYDDGTVIRKLTATSVSVTGTIAITGDAYGSMTLHLTVTSLTVNGTACEGGIDMTVVAAAPANLATATGTACGRVGSVPLP